MLREIMPDTSLSAPLSDIKLLETKKSRRRRVLERMSRFSSSPSLARPTSSKPPSVHPKTAASCVSLGSAAGASLSDRMVTPPSTPGAEDDRAAAMAMASGSSLDLYVECEEGLMEAEQEQEEEEEKTRGDGWERLPHEVRMGVLGWLNPLELVRYSGVSKEWNKLCFDGQLWQTLDASEFYERVPVDQLAKMIVSAGPFVRHLNLRGCVQLQTDWRTQAVANACRNLVSVSLEGTGFDRRIVHFVLTRNPTLKHLNISGLDSVTNATCRVLASSCPLLETLNISFCTNADARGLRRIVQACPNLRELKASELNVNDAGFMLALHNANSLERLHLGDTTGLTDDLVRLLVQGASPQLDPFTDVPVAPPRKLRHLALGKCTSLTDEALRYLAPQVPLLEQLELGAIPTLTDAGLAALLPHVPNLTHLDLEECVELTNGTLDAIADAPCVDKLVHLQASYCEAMDDTGVSKLLRKAGRLRNLEIDNTRISDLTLVEAGEVVAARIAAQHSSSPSSSFPPSLAPSAARIALRLVVFDCSLVTWSGIRGIMVRNAANVYVPGAALVQLKCFYEHQKAVDEHLRLVLMSECAKARRLEREWCEWMRGVEEQNASERSRRRGGGAHVMWGDDGHTGGRFRRGRGMCAIM